LRKNVGFIGHRRKLSRDGSDGANMFFQHANMKDVVNQRTQRQSQSISYWSNFFCDLIWTKLPGW
jgi:hypothetical protein